MGRERFQYYTIFQAVLATFAILGAIKKHNPALLVPPCLMSIGWSYQYDMLYGNMQ